MRRSNIKREKPMPKKHPLGTSILEAYWDSNFERMYYTDGFRTLSVIPGKPIKESK